MAGQVLSQTNAERRAAGLGPLAIDMALGRAAQGHACWMAETGRFSHTGARGSRLTDRLRAAGYIFAFGAENIAMGQLSAQAVMQGWLTSRGHRDNLLSPKAREIGIALATGRDGRPIWVMIVGARL